MQTPSENTQRYPFDHSWTPFQKKIYSYRPEMIILPDWSNRCLRCCVVGHYSNSCPLPLFPKNDLCMRCHAKIHHSGSTCPNENADMKDWVCMTYMPTKSETAALKPKTALDAYYDQRKQTEPPNQHQCFYCNQPDHPGTQCQVRQQSLDSSALSQHPPPPNPTYQTITFHSQMHSPCHHHGSPKPHSNQRNQKILDHNRLVTSCYTS